MQIFINELSFHEQFIDRKEMMRAFKVFFLLLNTVREAKQEYIFYKETDALKIYKAFEGEVLAASLNHLRDKSLSLAITDTLFNRLKTEDWRDARIHSPDDYYGSDEDCVTDTSVAELAERLLGNAQLKGLLLNFPKSKYAARTEICVVKNEIALCNLSCFEEGETLSKWIELLFGREGLVYTATSVDPPRDRQTILRDAERFEKTQLIQSGRKVFREIQTQHYWYVDSFHYGNSAHLEVFDSHGIHVGEADLEGIIDILKKDLKKKIQL